MRNRRARLAWIVAAAACLSSALALLHGPVGAWPPWPVASPGDPAASTAAWSATAPSVAAVEVVGRAAVYGGDRQAARSRALDAAFLQALEQRGGIRLTSTTLATDGQLVQRELRAAVAGRVQGYEILDEGENASRVWARVRVRVAPAPLAELPPPEVPFAVLVELWADDPDSDRILREALSRPAPDVARFAIVDPGGAAPRHDVAFVVRVRAHSRLLDVESDALGYAVPSDALPRVATAGGEVSVMTAGDRALVASVRLADIRAGSAGDPLQARERALEELARRSRDFVAETIARQTRGAAGRLRVEVTAALDGAELQGLRATLATMRWVDAARIARTDRSGATITLEIRAPAGLVVEEIRGRSVLRVEAFDAAARLLRGRPFVGS